MPDPIATTGANGGTGNRVDDGSASAPGSAVTPSASAPVACADTPLPAGGGRYEFIEELAHGGMGVVFRATDTTLGREVAVKVLKGRYSADSAAARRFVDEARVTGQLQHPAIPAVHDLGTLADGRSFLAMKLIKGRTLEQLLQARPDPAHDRGRFLAIFEQVCQAVGFAHHHQVIHRDLKPSNVMVGGFGEVQVMDWGLAKVLSVSARSRPDDTDADATLGTEIRSAREQDGSYTQAGSVLGTPAFMPPEQAGGEIDKIDERADVFGLGAILAVELTGQPPYVGPDREAIRLMAVRGQLADCLARLDGCSAEPGLVELCKRCLAFDPTERPRNGEVVAKEVAALRAAAEQRARQAELERVRAEGERAKAEAETREQRKRRWVQAGLGMTFTALVVLGGTFAWWQDSQAAGRRREREVAVTRARQGADAAIELAGRLRDQFRFAEAIQALDQAAGQVPADAPAEIRDGLDRARADLVLVRELDEIRFSRVRSDPLAGLRGLARAFRTAFQARGLDLSGADPAVAEAMADSPVRAYLVVGLDDWAHNEPDPQTRDRLLALARRADPGPWADRMRDPKVFRDPAFFLRLAKEAPVADLPPNQLMLLLQGLQANWPGSREALAVAAARHPGDFWLQFEIGYHYIYKDVDPARAAAHLRAALAVRPDCRYALRLLAEACLGLNDVDGAMACCLEAIRLDPMDPNSQVELANTLRHKGDLDGATKHFREALRLSPKDPGTLFNLGLALGQKGDLDGAIAAYKENLRIDPKSPLAHLNLGLALKGKGDMDGAITCFREAIRLKPNDASAHTTLGNALRQKGDVDGAIAAYKEAARLDPESADAHNDLGLAYFAKADWVRAIPALEEAIRLDPKNSAILWNLRAARGNLGDNLRSKGDLDGAIREDRELLRLVPDDADYHRRLGNDLRAKGDLDAATREYREAIRLSPKEADFHLQLGYTLKRKGDLDGAIREYREAVRLDPKRAEAHAYLGLALSAKGDFDGASAALQEAIRLDPKNSAAHGSLGDSLWSKGDLDGAIREYRETIRLDPKVFAARVSLGAILCDNKQDYDGAIACFREAIRLAPKNVVAHHNLGIALGHVGDLNGAIAAFREAIRVNPKYALAHTNLGKVLERKGDLDGAIREYQEADRLDPKNPLSADLRRVRRWQELLPRLPDVAAGRAEPKNPAEAVEFAKLCAQPFQRRRALAARLYEKAFTADPRLADPLVTAHRYDAACYAALAGCGEEADAGTLSPAARAALRAKALAWLRADLTVRKQQASSGNAANRKVAAEQMAHWLADSDLKGVRPGPARVEMPAEERAAWDALWAEVRTTRDEALKPSPKVP